VKTIEVSNPQGDYEIDLDHNGEPLAIRTKVHPFGRPAYLRKLWTRERGLMSITARCAYNAYRRTLTNK